MTLLNDALDAYLTPLLEKHAASQVIIYDDLMHAWQASQTLLKQNFDPAVSKHMRELHESQLAAYEEAARTALTELLHSTSLPSPGDNEDEDQYVEKVVSSTPKADWKLTDEVLEQVWLSPLREKARAAFIAKEAEEDQNEEGEDVSTEEDEMEDDDNGDDEEQEEEEKSKDVVKIPASKKRAVPVKAGKTALLKKKGLGTPNKAATGARSSRGRRARRGGRGGGVGGAPK